MTLKRITTPTPRGPAPESDVYREILYVEDDDDNWELTYLALRDKFLLHRAKDSTSALERLKNTRYSIVLMDIELSGSRFNGIEITEKVKKEADSVSIDNSFEINKDTPIVFVTAYGARYSRSELIAAGASEVVEKPVDFGKLSRVILKLTLNDTYQSLSRIRKELGHSND